MASSSESHGSYQSVEDYNKAREARTMVERPHKYAPIMDGKECCQYCMAEYPAKNPVCEKAPDDKATIATLRAERDEARRSSEHWHECFVALNKAVVGETGLSAITVAPTLRARAEAAEASLAEVRDALEPLIAYINKMDARPGSRVNYPDDRWVTHGEVVGGFTFGDLRDLRTALARLDTEKK